MNKRGGWIKGRGDIWKKTRKEKVKKNESERIRKGERKDEYGIVEERKAKDKSLRKKEIREGKINWERGK